MRYIVASLLAVLLNLLPVRVDFAFADNIHIGGNETHNTRVTANGGQGGHSYSGSESKSYSSSYSGVELLNINGQDQGQNQGQDQKQNVNNKQNIAPAQSTVIHGDRVVMPRQAPPAIAPGLAAAPETCMGSTSSGVSSPWFGLSFGTTWKSEDCELRMFARSLMLLAQPDAALILLAYGNERIALALKMAGYALPPFPTVSTPKPGLGSTPALNQAP